MARSLNVIHLIGNLTRDPELRYTSSGRAVCTFGLATNRSRKTENGELREESSFHRVVAWEKLAEQCAQLLVKGRRVYVQGRLGYRTYQKDDETREVAEIIIEDMLLLDAKPSSIPASRGAMATAESARFSPSDVQSVQDTQDSQDTRDTGQTAQRERPTNYTADEIADGIPF